MDSVDQRDATCNMADTPCNLFATCDTARSTVSLSHASCNFADMKAGDDEETSVKLVQTVEKFVYLYDFSHKYYVNNNKKDAAWREVSKEMEIITYLTETQ
jgi:hypothetical protein